MMALRRRRARPLLPVLVTLLALAAGPFRPAESAAQQGGMDITVRGIEDAIKQLNAVQGNPQAQQAAIVLLLIQGAGKKQPNEGGRTRYDYHIDIRPDGKIFINSLDLTVLLQAVQPRRQ